MSALITPDGRDVIVVTWRDLTPQARTHTVVVQLAELQAATGRLVRVLYTQTGQYDQVPFITLQDSLGVLSLGSQGRYALVQRIRFGWLDVGGPDPGQFAPPPRSRPASTSTLPPGNREVIRQSRRRSARVPGSWKESVISSLPVRGPAPAAISIPSAASSASASRAVRSARIAVVTGWSAVIRVFDRVTAGQLYPGAGQRLCA